MASSLGKIFFVAAAALAITAGLASPSTAQTQATLSTKQLVSYANNGTPQTGALVSVNVTALSTGYSVHLASTSNASTCLITLPTLADALALRAAIVADKTTKVVCRNDKVPAGSVILVNVAAQQGSFEVDAAP